MGLFSRLKNDLISLHFLLVALFFFCLTETGSALSYGTPNSIAASAMTTSLNSARQSGKKGPRSWEEMADYFGRPIDEVFPYVTPFKRYTFIREDVRLHGERIVLIMRSPFRDARIYTTWYGRTAHGLRERGRWVIVEDKDSIYRARYGIEADIVDAFATAGVSLPTPDGLGPFPHELEFGNRFDPTIIVVCLAGGLAFLIFRVVRVRQALKG